MEKDGEMDYRNKYMYHSNETKWQALQKTIYDPSNNTIFGRTPKSWGQLIFFYIVFYAVLAALFAICMQALMATIDDVEPKWKQEKSLIGINPGLGFRPLPGKTDDGALIWYNEKNATSAQVWIDLLDEFMKPYHADTTGKNMVSCDYDRRPDNGSVCIVNTTLFGHCSPSNGYGYRSASPCIFLKLNRIWGWEPQYYTDIVDDMPEDLKIAINGTPEAEREKIWIHCEGEGPGDKENVQQLLYYPHQGFPGYYYPFRNVKNYLSPLIAVQIVNPAPNVLINVECRAWAKNILYSRSNLNREGSAHFEVMVDSKPIPI